VTESVTAGSRHLTSDTVLGPLVPLIERGQTDGVFRGDVPVSWHLAMVMALIHAGSGELSAGRVRSDAAEAALIRTVLGAIAAAPPA
jgi:TetR/AcrR family transcriptional repressor of mexCD-oprJ operon